MPFASRSFWFSSGVPWLEQPRGTVGNLSRPITWIGMEVACSPASLMSAVCTGPHVTLSTNGRHSTTGAPPAPVCCGSGRVRALDSTRSPVDPVSTRMLLIVWQFDVPGTQIVTVVNGSLSESLLTPPFTIIGSTFDVVAATVIPEPLVGEAGVPVVPHCGVETCATSRSVPAISRRDTTGWPRGSRQQAGAAARTPCRKTRAGAR